MEFDLEEGPKNQQVVNLKTDGTFHNKEGGEPMQAYCMKCRTKREMKDTKAITMKNGRPVIQGVCPTCGTKMFRIGKN